MPTEATAMESTIGFRIRKASVEDDGRIGKFMEEAYIKHEPLSVSLGLSNAGWSDEDEEDTGILSEGVSLIAESLGRSDCEDGMILGLCLNGEMSADDANILEHKAINCKDKQFAKILTFLSAMDRRANVWERFKLSRGMGIFVMAVANSATGRGIGSALMERSREVAKENGFPMIRVDCTSHYSAKITERLGMDCVFSLPYDQYKEDGQIVFSPPSPHTQFRMFVQRLTV